MMNSETIRRQDVLLARNGGAFDVKRPGNKTFLELLKGYAKDYQRGNRTVKTRLLDQIEQDLADIRFFKPNGEVLEPKKKRDKACKQLKEIIAALPNNNEPPTIPQWTARLWREAHVPIELDLATSTALERAYQEAFQSLVGGVRVQDQDQRQVVVQVNVVDGTLWTDGEEMSVLVGTVYRPPTSNAKVGATPPEELIALGTSWLHPLLLLLLATATRDASPSKALSMEAILQCTIRSLTS